MAASDLLTPWTHLDEHGAGLNVDTFITTLMSQVGNSLRRTITVPYADQFGLTVSEWRVLSLIAHVRQISFADLVIQSTSDKALVSRTLKLLESRGFVLLIAEGTTPRKKTFCAITADGHALYEQAITVARARQAAALSTLTSQERDGLYHALRKLQQYCQTSENAPSSSER